VKKPSKTWRIITAVLCIAVIGVCIWFMVHGTGLNPDLDFGAGAYYYADDPALSDMASSQSVQTSLPYVVYVAIFLAWGALMYLLWKWVDRR